MERNNRRVITGYVTSDAMDKTIVVAVEQMKMHPLYKKRYIRTNKFKVHDENNEARVGDRVRAMETRPLSKDKHFRLTEIVEKAK